MVKKDVNVMSIKSKRRHIINMDVDLYDTMKQRIRGLKVHVKKLVLMSSCVLIFK